MKMRPHLLLACIGLVTGCAARPVAAPAGADSSWISRSAIYEVFVRDFSATGDLQGVIDGLDRIESTGANVVWLMPIHPVGVLNRKGSLGSSYSVRDYRAVNSEYGTEADFRRLVSAVHARGMKLIIDWVPNHTAWDHVWTAEHPQFYTRDERGELRVPRNNEGEPTDWTDVAELDYENPALRRAMIADMRYWLDHYRIDGFRVDVAGMVPDDFWREAIPQLRSVQRPILLLAEWGDPRMHELGFDLTYGWDSYHRLKAVWRGEQPASSFADRELEEVRTLPEGDMRLRFTTNHDETAWDAAPVTLFGGPAGARAAFVAMALLPGPPLLYNGQEVESPQRLGLFEKEPIVWGQPGADAARAFYRRVVHLARSHDAFTAGDFQPAETDAPQDVIAYRRAGVRVLVNTRPRPVQLRVSGFDADGARDLLSGLSHQGKTLTLPAYGSAVLERTR